MVQKDRLIATVKEIIQNVDMLHRFGKGDEQERQFHDKTTKNGKLFVAVKQGEKYKFAPSKFAGYAANDLQHLDKRQNRDGRITNRQIKDVLGPALEIDSASYQSIDHAYLTYCAGYKIEPSQHHKPRKYWLISREQPETIAAEDYETMADLLERKTNTLRRKWKNSQSIAVPAGASEPALMTVISTRYVRSAEVRAYVLVQSNGCCQACGNRAPFQTPDGNPFLEVHHITHLADGGPDTVANAAALCPNCHRRLHYSADKKSFRQDLVNKVSRLNYSGGKT